MLNICDFIQVYVFTTNHHLNHARKMASLCHLLLESDSKKNLYWSNFFSIAFLQSMKWTDCLLLFVRVKKTDITTKFILSLFF